VSTIGTFVDAGVLIAASRGVNPESEPALQLIEDNSRELLTSVFVRLETYPKAVFNPFPMQRAFLAEFVLDPDVQWATDVNAIVNLAVSEADRHGPASDGRASCRRRATARRR
jgi:hypothetical protein